MFIAKLPLMKFVLSLIKFTIVLKRFVREVSSAQRKNFKMLPNELVEHMYSRLNVLVEDINALEISPLSSSDVIRKILHSLHKPKYNIVTSLLYEKEIDTTL